MIERHDTMRNLLHPSPGTLSRRSLLRSAGAVAVSGGVLAACGDPIDKQATRIGESPSTTALKTAEVNDIVLLRTAMSMERLVHDILTNEDIASAFVSGSSPSEWFAPAHRRSLAALSALVTARGGEPYDEANPKLMSVYGSSAIELVAGSDQKKVDAHVLAHGLETLLASTYQLSVATTTEPALRAEMMGLAARASRNAAIAAQLIRGGVSGFAPATDENGVALVATLPSAFGSLTAVQVTIGKPNETGARTQLTMDTPSLNSYIYID